MGDPQTWALSSLRTMTTTNAGGHREARHSIQLDTGAIVTIERDDEDASTTPMLLAAAIVVAVEREMSLRGSTNRLQERHEP